MDVVVNPPKPGEPSYASFIAQKEGTLKSLAERAKLVADTFNSIEGFTCQTVQGAMYAFPRVSVKNEISFSFFKIPNVFSSTLIIVLYFICSYICLRKPSQKQKKRDRLLMYFMPFNY